MPLSSNEIRQRAIAFSRDWATASRERSEAQTFWNEFFHVFGRHRRTVANFEETVRSHRGSNDFIDLLWPGMLIAEHKSRGRDLAKAHTQAVGYINDLLHDGRAADVPRYILVSDFARLALHDLEPPEDADPEDASFEFPLADLHQHIHRLAFIAGYESRTPDPEDPANIEAAELLANLHDRLEDGGYGGNRGHDLQRFMVRILFCLFAEDTELFDEPEAFKYFILHHTREDGSDLGPQLSHLFQVLNTPHEHRQSNLNEHLAALPYVNGQLFSESLHITSFNSDMRNALLTCCGFRWNTISPAIFGSLFQSIMDSRERRQIGAHYTSERDILKLIDSLFLDQLKAEFEKARNTSKPALRRFHHKLASLTFLDPACGCGNFLVIAYRELRDLELQILKALHPDTGFQAQLNFQLKDELLVQVDQMHGIEIEEWPARIAEVALWLVDHQKNLEASTTFGQLFKKLPLIQTPHIQTANALQLDWNTLLPADRCNYVMGNPPFVGKHLFTPDQAQEMKAIWGDVKGSGVLDYVTAWYRRAIDYIGDHPIAAAFVSTNSVTQGEQVAPLWDTLFNREFAILFGHRTFKWESEARGKAHVHVVIVGFAKHPDILATTDRRITDYDKANGDRGNTITVKNITPYLTEGSSLTVKSRSKPLADVPETQYGNKPTDGGHLIINDDEKAAFVAEYPCAEPFIRPMLSADQYLDGRLRWCLWLVDAPPAAIRNCPGLLDRIEKVRAFRLASKKAKTREDAAFPSLFAEIRQPTGNFMLIPRHSSERREYIPFGFFDDEFIVHDSCTALPGATLYHFAILHSAMHMAWVRQVCGRLKSDFRYSATLVYNNFPWPPDAPTAGRTAVEAAAQAVLDARAPHLPPKGGSTLADLYDPLTMPPALAKAHATLDRAVDRLYRSQPFPDERRRFEHLFTLYESLTAPLTGPTSRKKKR